MSITTVGKKWFPLLFIALFLSSVVKADISDFILECPKSVTISCNDDTRDLSRFGKAYIWQHHVKRDAGPATRVIKDLNDCGAGTIERIWEVEDHNWKIHRCTQIITVADNGIFDASDITWPEHFDTSSCKVNLDPRTLKKPYDIPRFNKVGCSKPIFNYKDDVLTFSPSCKKILRRWRVIDCCQFDPSKPGTGEWIHYQIIKVVVNDTPKIVCPTHIEVDAQDCDGAFVKMDSIFGKDKCGNVLVLKNNSKYSTDKGPNASGKYPIGATEFYYTVEYSCGKSFKCKVKVVVKDKLLPSPYCRNGLIVTLMGMDTDQDGINDEGMVEVWAKDMDIGSFHKCGKRNLTLSFSSDTSHKVIIFTCYSVGRNVVELWVTDEQGNQAFCRTYIIVQNNGSNIPDCERDTTTGTIYNIAGSILSLNGSVNKNVAISLTSPSMYMDVNTVSDSVITVHRDTFVGKTGTVYVKVTRDTQLVTTIDTTYSDMLIHQTLNTQGAYGFINMPVHFPYILKPSTANRSFKGVDMQDAYALLMHLIGWRPFKNAYQYLVADLNGDQLVNNTDYQILINAVMVGKYPKTVQNYWLFVDQSTQLKIATIFDQPCPDNIRIKDLVKDEMDQNFYALKMGDLNFDVENSVIHNQHSLRDANELNIEILNHQLVQGEEQLIPIFKQDASYVMGQLNFSFDLGNIEILGIEDGTAICHYKIVEHGEESASEIMINWIDPNIHPALSPIAYMKVKSNNDNLVSDLLSLNNYSINKNTAFTKEEKWAKTNLLFRDQDEIYNQLNERDGFKFVPNPFYQNTQLQFHLNNKTTTSYSLVIYNAMGVSILKRKGTFDGDEYLLDLNLANVPDHVMFYKLDFGGQTYSGKLIHLTD